MYVSGSIGLDPTTAALVSGGIEPETEQVWILWFISAYIAYIMADNRVNWVVDW